MPPVQKQGPPPEITQLVSGDKSLVVKWEQDPYEGSSDATLIYIDSVTNSMYSVLLNAEQIADEEYTLTNLVNGNEYAVLFSLIATDGVTHNSNTLRSTPSKVPDAPIINSYTLQSDKLTVLVNVTPGSNGGSPITGIVFRLYNETTGTILTDAKDKQDNGDYMLEVVPGNEYIISAQSQNIAGYSMVSNSISFKNSNVPMTPFLAPIQSGEDSKAILKVSGTNSNPAITAFVVDYRLSSTTAFSQTVINKPISASGNYSVDLELDPTPNGLENESVGYIVRVAARNPDGDSLFSETQNVVPALQLEFSNVDVTFPTDSEIKVNYNRNTPSWNQTGSTFVTFSGVSESGSFSVTQSYSNNMVPGTASYFLPTGDKLVAANSYSVTIAGYTVVPQNLYGDYWVEPVLSDLKFEAVPVTESQIYATVPSPISNGSYITEIVDLSGQIQFNWIENSDGGSPITSYNCVLYTISQGVRTVLKTIQTTAENCLFSELNTDLYYSLGVVAQNAVGDSDEVFIPSGNTGIIIVDSVNSVTQFVATQTNYTINPNKFYGKLSWEYSGPGTNYTGVTSFKIYSVDNLGNKTLLDTVPYVSSTLLYTYDVDLGSVPNINKSFAVQAVNSDPVGSSLFLYANVRTGVAPIISDVVLSAATGTWTLTFKVTNPTNSPMVQDSILSLVMPSPVGDISTVNPIYNGYDVSLVPNQGSYVFTHQLGYVAISDDYLLITAANQAGSTSYANKWGSQ